MTVLERNLRVGRLEIDIVARDGPVIAIIEVRTRGPGAWQGPLSSIDAGKRKRLRRAAERLWLRRFRHLEGIERLRFDVAAVDLEAEPGPEVEYIRGAF